MSILLYARLTTLREENPPGTTTNLNPPGLKTYVDTLAALVPSEVLALHATILTVTTKTENAETTITEPGTLNFAFWGLVALSLVMYAGVRWITRKWDRLDWFRMCIPPLAFVGWTMLQRATAFDAVFPGASSAARTVFALFLAVVLGLVAWALAYQADQKPVKADERKKQ